MSDIILMFLKSSSNSRKLIMQMSIINPRERSRCGELQVFLTVLIRNSRPVIITMVQSAGKISQNYEKIAIQVHL